MHNRGLLIVISGPSGAGKGTICKALLEKRDDLFISVSATTRSPRAGEVDGVNYHFLTKEDFIARVEKNDFLEYANVHGNMYGTPKFKVEEMLAEGKNVILEIDIQGALKVKENFEEGVFIFILPPSMEELKQMSMLGKMPEGLYRPILAEETFSIGDLSILPFEISHDAAEPVGYRVSHGEKSVGIATDMGVYDEKIVENLQGLDALLLEANHDVRMLQVGAYPYSLKQRILGEKGHLSNESAGRLLCRLLHDKMKQIMLGHLSRENNYEILAYETVCAEVTMGENPWKSSDFKISVAHRDRASELITV